MTDSSHLAAPSSGRTSGDAAPTDQIAGPVARINSRVHNCIEWLDANAAANLPNGTPLFTHRPTDDKLFTRPTPAAAADWQISAIADKHVSTFDGRRVLDEVSFGRELLQTLASPAAAAGVPTLKAREHWSTINERLAVLVNMNSLEARPGHEYLNREMVMREVCRIRDAADALLSAQGCELATDATKQPDLLELAKVYSSSYASPHHITFTLSGLKALLSHLAAPQNEEDFRRRPASSEAAPKQPDSDSVHPAMSTSSVPTAAPLLSSRETDRSELPREPS